jgi:hypothetical protein
MRQQPHDLLGRFVLTLALLEDLRSRLSSVHVRSVTSTTNSGRTQCTRDSLSGGGALRGIFGALSGASTPAKRFGSFSFIPVPARPA